MYVHIYVCVHVYTFVGNAEIYLYISDIFSIQVIFFSSLNIALPNLITVYNEFHAQFFNSSGILG